MRRVFLLLLAGLALVGCGSSRSSSSPNPAQTEASYFPASSPFVMSVATDPGSSAIKNAEGLASRFPFASFGESALTSKLQQVGINYQTDVRPLLGNPVMVGISGSTTNANVQTRVLFVWMTKDSAALGRLISKLHLQRAQTHGGATLYDLGPATLAVDGATVLAADSPEEVTTAIDRHANGSGITSSAFSHAFTGLPQGSLIQAFGNLTSVLSQPSAAKAKRVPWVAALRGYAVTGNASSSGLNFQYRLDTSGATLNSSQVPLAPGAPTPALAGNQPINAGVANPAHIAAFAEAAEQATDPAAYGRFLRRQAGLRAKTGVDLNSLLKLLTGELIVQSDTHTTVGRAAVSDPAAAKRTLSKLMSNPRAIAARAQSVRHLPGGFYAIKEPHQLITIGMAGNQLVVGKATPAQLRAFAAAPTAPTSGTQGSVVFRVALTQLLHVALRHAPSQITQAILSSLGDITGSVSAGTTELTGTATLAVR